MKLIHSWNLPIKTISEANCVEHWTKRAKRHKLQKNWIKAAFQSEEIVFPQIVHIKMIRISPRFLDDDNLVSAFKHIRDAIASQLRPNKAPGQADNDKDITWQYAQEKGKSQMVRIEIYAENEI